MSFQITKEQSLAAGSISEVAVNRWGAWSDGETDVNVTNGAPLVTAVRNGSGNIQVILWEVSENPWKRIRSMEGGKATDIAMVIPTVADAVTAHVNDNGKLELNLWDTLPAHSDQSPEASAIGGQASEVALAFLTWPRFVTAVRDSENELRLAVWDYDSSSKTFTKIEKGDFRDAGEATQISIARTAPFEVVTAVRTASGTLKIIFWRILPDGTIMRENSGTEGNVSKVRVAALGGYTAITAVRNGLKDLELDKWDASNGSVQKLAGNSAGEIDELDVANLYHKMVTAVRESSGKLKLIVWDVGGNSINRLGSMLGETATKISACGAFHTDNGFARVITAFRDSGGDLKITAWKLSGF